MYFFCVVWSFFCHLGTKEVIKLATRRLVDGKSLLLTPLQFNAELLPQLTPFLESGDPFCEADHFWYPFVQNSKVLLMEEILHQLIWRNYHYLQGFIHLRWCRISSINSRSSWLFLSVSWLSIEYSIILNLDIKFSVMRGTFMVPCGVRKPKLGNEFCLFFPDKLTLYTLASQWKLPPWESLALVRWFLQYFWNFHPETLGFHDPNLSLIFFTLGWWTNHPTIEQLDPEAVSSEAVPAVTLPFRPLVKAARAAMWLLDGWWLERCWYPWVCFLPKKI